MKACEYMVGYIPEKFSWIPLDPCKPIVIENESSFHIDGNNTSHVTFESFGTYEYPYEGSCIVLGGEERKGKVLAQILYGWVPQGDGDSGIISVDLGFLVSCERRSPSEIEGYLGIRTGHLSGKQRIARQCAQIISRVIFESDSRIAIRDSQGQRTKQMTDLEFRFGMSNHRKLIGDLVFMSLINTSTEMSTIAA